jgi:trehalose 6-phosphate synthase
MSGMPPRLWDGAALRRLMASAPDPQEVIVLSDRQPFTHERVGGQVRVTQPASGLATAMEPVLRACGGTWIAQGSGDADRDVVDANDVWPVPADLSLHNGSHHGADASTGRSSDDGTGRGEYRLRRLWLSADEERGYRDGFSNSGLWPLCHLVHVRPAFHAADWRHYQAVNRRFAEAVVDEASTPNPLVMVHDHQLALVPALLRSLLPRATIVSFWHIPWAPSELMSTCPWLPALMHGLLGSDIVGFQTDRHRRNFVDSAERCGNTVSGPDRRQIAGRGRSTQVRDYPISIAWPGAPNAETKNETNGGAAQFTSDALRDGGGSRDALAGWPLPADGKLIVGIDRMDYTKGLVERLRAVDHLLEHHPQWRGRLRFVQVAAPSRTALPEYAAFREQVLAEAARVNARYAAAGWKPVVLLEVHHDRAAVQALYRAADLCLVTSLHDGMNLVCKEFVAARDDEQGVLVLSEFAGAADALQAALIVNPYHTEQVAEAIHRGLTMPPDEQRRRMQALRATVRDHNVHRWAASLLLDAAQLRKQRPPLRAAGTATASA